MIKEKVTVVSTELLELFDKNKIKKNIFEETISKIVVENNNLEYIKSSIKDIYNVNNLYKLVDGIILPTEINYVKIIGEVTLCEECLLCHLLNTNKEIDKKKLKKVAIFVVNSNISRDKTARFLHLHSTILDPYRNLFKICYDLEECYSFLFNYHIYNNKLLEYIGFNEGIEEIIIQKV